MYILGGMMNKLDDKLQSKLKKAAKNDPEKLFAFIVTYATDAKIKSLTDAGLKIENRFEVINAVSGKMTAKQALKLARRKDIERIELDGEVRAL
jgi:hypothetical protein